jgi:hypothetical protein
MTTSYYVLSSATWEWVDSALPSPQRVNEALEFRKFFVICEFFWKTYLFSKNVNTFAKSNFFIKKH